MIRAEFFTLPDNTITGFHISGHAGFADAGEDVVCAFVSSAAYMTANTITDVMGIDAQAEAGDGDMLLRVSKEASGQCKVLFEGLKLHLLSTQEQYPECLKVIFTEV